VPDVAEQLALIDQLRGRARRCLQGRIDRERSWLAAARSRPALASPQRELDRRQEHVLALAERGRIALSADLGRRAADVAHLKARIIALSPAATLRRGYAIVQQDSGHVVLRADQVSAGEELTVRFADDQLQVTAAAPSRRP